MTRPPISPGNALPVGPHLDEERIVDLALAEPADESEREHLTGCARCRDGLGWLRHTLDVTRDAATTELLAPPADLWTRITDTLDDDASTPVTPGEPGAPGGPGAPGVPAAPAAPGPGVPTRLVGSQPKAAPDVAVVPPGPTASASPEVVVPLRPGAARPPAAGRRRPAPGWLAAACAAGVLLGAGGVVLADRLQSGTDPGVDVIRTVASAELDTLDTRQRLGSATVSERDGALNLAVSATELDRGADGYVEVWLINRDGKRMVSVGVLGDGAVAGAFPVSRSLLDEGYVVVDLSREQFDDKPQHSGDSLVRGTLSTPA